MKENAIEFAQYLSDNMFEQMYTNTNEPNRVWVSYNDEGFDNVKTANLYTLEEIYNEYESLKNEQL